MLQALTIRNFAIIDQLELELGPGLTVITGETGAGKSVLIGALNLVLGGRARIEVVRTGADRAEVQALFDLSNAAPIRARLEAAGIEANGELVVRRVIARNGRHRVYLNGSMATKAMLAHVTQGLVDISGQHEHYSLLRSEFHLDLLDRVAGLEARLDTVAAAHRTAAAVEARVKALEDQRRNRSEREAFLQFQLQALDSAGLDDPGEEDALEAEVSRLSNVERLRDAAFSGARDLYDAEGAAVERVGRALRAVETLASLDEQFAPLVDDLASALAIAEDAAHTLRDYASDLSADPARLEEMHTRLALFARLRHKYGATLAEVMVRRDEMQAELATLGSTEEALEVLESERAAASAALGAEAAALTAARRAGATRFATAVCAELADLGMAGATLEMRLEPVTSGVRVGAGFVGPRGADRAELLLSANPGEAPQPLSRIASGGELSRFMLAVKRVIANKDPVSTYIFDEVDSGVGGSTADAIGRKLKAVSADRQALCITHLPQIAAMADHHLFVQKSVEGKRTASRVHRLDRKARVEELARMLGGAEITKTTRAHARELLRSAPT